MFMTTNARSMTSPVSTFTNPLTSPVSVRNRAVPASASSAQRTDFRFASGSTAKEWWERPPSTPGAVHVSLCADRGSGAISAIRSRMDTSPASAHRDPEQGGNVRTGAPTRRDSVRRHSVGRPSVGRDSVGRDSVGRNAASRDTVRQELQGRQGNSRFRLVPLVGIILAVFLGGFGIANAASSPKGNVRTYLVRPGDSFWSIARSMQTTGDVRPLVAALIDSHGTSLLQVGDRVELPPR